MAPSRPDPAADGQEMQDIASSLHPIDYLDVVTWTFLALNVIPGWVFDVAMENHHL
jgi:hypothetical protein